MTDQKIDERFLEVTDELGEPKLVQIEHSKTCPNCGGPLRETRTGSIREAGGEVYDDIVDWDTCVACGYAENYDEIQLNRIRYLPIQSLADIDGIPF